MKPKHYAIIIILLFFGVFTYFQVRSAIEYRCQSAFGPELNARRQKLNVAIIPSNWVVRDRDHVHTWWWIGKDYIPGHKSKVVVYHGCDIVSEYDTYYIKPRSGKQQRWLEVEYVYANARHPDSTKYTYQVEDRANLISKDQADSLFKAEKISKD